MMEYIMWDDNNDTILVKLASQEMCETFNSINVTHLL